LYFFDQDINSENFALVKLKHREINRTLSRHQGNKNKNSNSLVQHDMLIASLHGSVTNTHRGHLDNRKLQKAKQQESSYLKTILSQMVFLVTMPCFSLFIFEARARSNKNFLITELEAAFHICKALHCIALH